jgi:hypothetical protein
VRSHRPRRIASPVIAAVVTLGLAGVTGATADARLVHGGACSRVQWRSYRDHNQRCPTSHSLLSDITWTGLHWTSWSAHQALGYDTYVHRNGVCDRVACHDQRSPIDIHLSHPTRCPDGATIWSRIDVIVRTPRGAIKERASVHYSCTPSPNTFGAGG